MLTVFLEVLLPVALVAVVGYALRWRMPLDQATLNRVVIYGMNPALIFTSLIVADLSGENALRMLALAVGVALLMGLVAAAIALPFGIFDKAGIYTPLFVMLVSYPLLSLDQISEDLQNPFSLGRVSHLPLNDICRNIEANVMALADDEPAAADDLSRRLRTPIAV